MKLGPLLFGPGRRPSTLLLGCRFMYQACDGSYVFLSSSLQKPRNDKTPASKSRVETMMALNVVNPFRHNTGRPTAAYPL